MDYLAIVLGIMAFSLLCHMVQFVVSYLPPGRDGTQAYVDTLEIPSVPPAHWCRLPCPATESAHARRQEYSTFSAHSMPRADDLPKTPSQERVRRQAQEHFSSGKSLG